MLHSIRCISCTSHLSTISLQKMPHSTHENTKSILLHPMILFLHYFFIKHIGLVYCFSHSFHVWDPPFFLFFVYGDHSLHVWSPIPFVYGISLFVYGDFFKKTAPSDSNDQNHILVIKQQRSSL